MPLLAKWRTSFRCRRRAAGGNVRQTPGPLRYEREPSRTVAFGRVCAGSDRPRHRNLRGDGARQRSIAVAYLSSRTDSTPRSPPTRMAYRDWRLRKDGRDGPRLRLCAWYASARCPAARSRQLALYRSEGRRSFQWLFQSSEARRAVRPHSSQPPPNG